MNTKLNTDGAPKPAPKHTPAPWFHEGGGTIADSNGGMIADVYVGAARSPEEHEGNAALIEAAPAMLEALAELVENNYGQPSGVTVRALDPARAIIAKARGEEAPGS